MNRCRLTESLSLARTLRAAPHPLYWQSARNVSSPACSLGLAVFVNLSCAAGAAALTAVQTVPAAWVVWSVNSAAVRALEVLNLTLRTDLTLVSAAQDGETAVLLDLYKVRIMPT